MAGRSDNDNDLFKILARELSRLKPEEREKIMKKLDDIRAGIKKKPEDKK
ncbi:MAG: hypothetical protein BWY32_02227 [bacterium ADurb.Bin243]|nr:MAG: hypothetical protein BWY32_02227 [bacterium ADurb.Bin243]